MTACACGAAAVVKGTCRRCYSRAYYAGRRRKQAPDVAAVPARPVAWDAVLTELRRAAGDGAAVGIGQRGLVIDRVASERLVFATIDDALDWATAPATERSA